MTGLEGKANVQQVVENVMSAERTLQTTLAIRDKTVAAWQQISQMPI
jgi:flagellar hook-basal body complex protein FliE